MKLSNKLLLSLALIFITLVTFYRTKYDGIIENVPIAKKNGIIEKYFEYKSLNCASFNGLFDITINKENKNFIKIKGPDILVDYYLGLANNNDTLSVNQKIDLSKYYGKIEIFIGVQNLADLKLEGGAACLVKNIDGQTLNIFAADSTVTVFLNCNYADSYINANDKASISFSKTKNSRVQLKGNSSLYLLSDGGNISGSVEPRSLLITDGNILKKEINSSDSSIAANGGRK